MSDIPRRSNIQTWTDAERAIQAAVDAVEAMPPDVRLTDAVTLLYEARQSVADYVDGIQRRRRVAVGDGAGGHPTPEFSEWVFVHEVGEWRCHCGYVATSWDKFVAHFNAPPAVEAKLIAHARYAGHQEDTP